MTVHARKLLDLPAQPFTRNGTPCDVRIADAELWHPDKKDTYSIEAGKDICILECPVVEECLIWSLDTKQPMGTYGGVSEWERAALLKKRRRANLKAVAAAQQEED